MPVENGRVTIPREIEQHLASGEVAAVEEAWMARLAEDPTDLAFFAAVARALGKAGEAETARFLLELLYEQLTEAGRWDYRLELLRRVGHLVVDADDLQPAILETLEKLHGHRPSYEQMVDKVGLHKAIEDIPKIWKKAVRLAGLLAFDVGSIVSMKDKGGGRVAEVNMALESFKVDFEGGLELRVGFGGAVKLLKSLAPDHVLYRKLEKPEGLIELRDKDSGELLRVVLESDDRIWTGAEIKRALVGIVAEQKWNSWWSAARKHPQVVAAPGKKRAYAWAASSEDAQGAVWKSFKKADVRSRMDLLRRDGERDPQLKVRMSEALSAQGEKLAAAEPGTACEVWFNLERSGEPPADWSPRTLIAELKDPRPLFAGIRDRLLRERAYGIGQEVRHDWPDLCTQLLWAEQDARSLDLLASSLADASPAHLDKFLDQLLSQPRRSPAAFTWFAGRAAGRPEWLARNPIRLLKQLLWVLSHRDFSSYRAARLVPLVESGGTLPRLLDLLSAEQAEEACTAIKKASGLEGYQRKPLLSAVHLRFPALRTDDEAPLYATLDKIDSKRIELKRIAEIEIPANRRAIEEAREMGDLRENFEYKAARQRHEYLSVRATSLHHDLSRVRPIDAEQVKGTEVVVGCKVALVAEGEDTRTITVLGPWESEPEKDILSNESEIGQALLGRVVGDPIELMGTSYRIEAIEPYE